MATTLQMYDPFAETGFDELFRGFFRPVRSNDKSAPAAIRIDVTESDKDYTVHAEIPGVKKDDIQVHACKSDEEHDLYWNVIDALAKACTRVCPNCRFPGMKDLACKVVVCFGHPCLTGFRYAYYVQQV